MGGLTSTPEQKATSADQAEAAARSAVMNMRGHDELPKSLRLFLHEWAGQMTPKQIDMMAMHLRAGRELVAATPDGRRVTLKP